MHPSRLECFSGQGEAVTETVIPEFGGGPTHTRATVPPVVGADVGDAKPADDAQLMSKFGPNPVLGEVWGASVRGVLLWD